VFSITPAKVAEVLNAELLVFDEHGVNSPVLRVHSDTRSLQKGDLFIAIKGERFDGHDYLELAAQNGAIAALVDKQIVADKKLSENSPLTLISVADTLAALGALSAWNRSQFKHPLLAITGSAGKTSVKTMAAHVLSSMGPCLATRGNLNNHIGAPLTLCELSESYSSAVIELGASAVGEIAYTANFSNPDVVILTNVSGAHLEGFGSIENIAKTKGEIIDAVCADGTAVLNRDDQFFDQWLQRAGNKKVISFGLTADADIYASDIYCSASGSEFSVHYDGQTELAYVSLLGQHNVINALSVIAATVAMGMSLQEVVAALRNLPEVPGRLQASAGFAGMQVIDDSYNASPASVKAAIDVLKLYDQKTWLVLGDMAELGEAFITTHQEIGVYAKEAGIDTLVATGTGGQSTVEAFAENAHWMADKNQVVEYLKNNVKPGQVVLIKGSRSAGMDEVVKALTVPAPNGEEE
jgi:UDP-N-acetylmuramoyl-tripeptide--D-alanyl-D-alanine ligase